MTIVAGVLYIPYNQILIVYLLFYFCFKNSGSSLYSGVILASHIHLQFGFESLWRHKTPTVCMYAFFVCLISVLRPFNTFYVISGAVSYPDHTVPGSWASLLGSLPVLSGAHTFADKCSSWISGRGRMAVEIFSWPSLHERMCRMWGSNSGPLACQADTLPIELPRPAVCMCVYVGTHARTHACMYVCMVHCLLLGSAQNNSSPHSREQPRLSFSATQSLRWCSVEVFSAL